MAEINVEFKNSAFGYNKAEVNQFVKDAESRIQEKSEALANLQQQVVDLEARLSKLTGNDASVEEKVELYDKLMKKLEGEYTDILAPAIAKAKAIEEKAEAEYAVRMDQARYSADGIYAEAADKIAGTVDENMDRLYGLLDDFIYSRSFVGRVKAFVAQCKILTKKVAYATNIAMNVPKKAIAVVKESYDKAQQKVATYKEAIIAAKNSK